jgi:hypothetical protein
MAVGTTTRASTSSLTVPVANLVAAMLTLAGSRMGASTLGHTLQCAGWSCFAITFFLQIRSGYLRRRPYWTGKSWRRFLLASAIPVVALLLLFDIMAAMDATLAFTGARRSALRGFWVTVDVLSMLFGAIGLAMVPIRLNYGDASQQFSWRRRS